MTSPMASDCPASDAAVSAMERFDDASIEKIAEYFRALSEPTRLKLLNALRTGERNVTELTAAVGASQANVSKHLAVLLAAGVVERSNRGTSAYYRIADEGTYGLCDLVCGQIGRRFAAEIVLRSGFLSATGATSANGTNDGGNR